MNKTHKNTLSLISLSFVILLFTGSCSSPSSNLKGIPAESSFVSVIDVYSLIKKGNVDKLKKSKLFKDAEGELKNENKRVSDLFKEAMNNPSSTGIDFTSDLINFSLNKYKGEHFFCSSMGLSDKETFKKFVSELLDESGVEYEIKNKENHSYIEMDNGRSALAWDKEKVIFLVPEDYKSRENIAYQANRFFILEKDEQLLSNDKFTSFLKNKEDVSMWISSNIIPKILGKRRYKRMQEESGFDIEDNEILCNISFNEGEIVLNSTFEMNEKMKTKYKNISMFSNDFNEDLLKIFPKKHLAFASVNLDVDKYIEAIQNDEKYEEILDNLTKQTRVNKEQIEEQLENFRAFKGSAIFSIFDVKNVKIEASQWQRSYYEENGMEVPERKETMPIFGIAFDIEAGELTRMVKNELESVRVNGYYKIKEGGVNFYIGYKNSIAFITNSEERIKDFVNKVSLSETLANSDIKSEILDNPLYINSNLKYEDYPEEMKEELEKSQNSYERELLRRWKNFAKSIEVKNQGIKGLEIKINLENKDENSLSTLLNLISETNIN